MTYTRLLCEFFDERVHWYNAATRTVLAVHARFYAEAGTEKARELSTATFVLLALSYDTAFLKTLTTGVREMRESSFYQMVLDEGEVTGRVREAQELLLTLGTRRFGLPTGAQRARIETETSRAQLEV